MNVFSKETILEIAERDYYSCVLCGNQDSLERYPHHAFYKSEYYKNDRNEAWNGVCICMKCHRKIHFEGDKQRELTCKSIALSRYQGKYRIELERIVKQKSYDK